jgi:hypothetical protein
VGGGGGGDYSHSEPENVADVCQWIGLMTVKCGCGRAGAGAVRGQAGAADAHRGGRAGAHGHRDRPGPSRPARIMFRIVARCFSLAFQRTPETVIVKVEKDRHTGRDSETETETQLLPTLTGPGLPWYLLQASTYPPRSLGHFHPSLACSLGRWTRPVSASTDTGVGSVDSDSVTTWSP